MCWSEQYLRSDLPRTKFRTGQFTAQDVDHYPVEQTISAGLLDSPMTEALAAQPGSPALVIARRTRDTRGRLVSVGIHTHPADRYEVTTTFGGPGVVPKES